MVLKRLTLIFAAGLLASMTAFAQVPIEHSDIFPSAITTKWFGPYAFPVPQQLQGQVSPKLRLEVGGDVVIGSLAGADNPDYTYAPTFKIVVPLWTDRVNFTVWGEMYEWYRDNEAVRQLRRVDPQYDLVGDDAGSTLFSLDVLVLKEGKYHPSVAARLATLTATGDHYETARHYDAPGCFFDISAGKDFALGSKVSLRASATFGLVVWQTDRGRQNDAWMTGAALSCTGSFWTVSAEMAGYSGWEKSDDAPVSLRARAELHFGCFSPYVGYVHGLRDYPFDIFSAGLRVDFDILKQK